MQIHDLNVKYHVSIYIILIFLTIENYGLSFPLCASKDEFLQQMNDIGDKSYIFQEEHNVPVILSAKRLEYAFYTYHKALEEYEKHFESLEPGQKSKIKRLSYREFATEYEVQHTTLMKQYKGKNKPYDIDYII